MLQNSLIKKVAYFFVAFLVIAAIFDYTWRCHIRSIDSVEATNIARDHLHEYAKSSRIDPNFSHSKTTYDNSTNLWSIEFVAANCTVAIIVDSCGVSDIAGTTECFGFDRKN